MKIMIYCQHVLGVGHFFRVLEIARQLSGHDVLLVTGGSDVPIKLPDHIRHFRLPGLMMDKNFSHLYSLDTARTPDQVRQDRRQILMALFDAEDPDVFLVELYPFGRKAFGFELDPVLDKIRLGNRCRVICSLRDILVEKKDRVAYESRVVDILNKNFDSLLIHSDPRVIPLETTFSRMKDIRVSTAYTGFVTPFPDIFRAREIRKAFGADETMHLVVVSAGGGSVGQELLMAAALAHGFLNFRVCMVLLIGPHMAEKERGQIQALAGDRLQVAGFQEDFVSLLCAADLSVSMGGYNTLANILAAGVPALVLPFDQNREQALRVKAFGKHALIHGIGKQDLYPQRLADRIQAVLNSRKPCRKKNRVPFSPDLAGAAASCRLIEKGLLKGEGK